jgi:hypothetical protein
LDKYVQVAHIKTLKKKIMTTNDKKALVFILLFISATCYYYAFPGRDWLGKRYLETEQNDGFAVVELFTSEGCSSCPPADDVLAKIQEESIGRNVYLLAYHVDYWDNNSWVDRFSSASFTERQKQYALRMKSDLVYTPQFIVNGITESAGDDARAIYRLIVKELQRKPADKLTLAANAQNESIEVSYKSGKTYTDSGLLIALIQNAASTKVARGENSGATLHHVQIVHNAQIVSLENAGGRAIFQKPKDFNTTDWQIIGFIQNDKSGEITAAASAEFK